MNRFYFLCLFILNSFSVFSQVDRFEDFNSMVGKKVCFYDAQIHLKEVGKFIYTMNEKNKLIAVKDVTDFQMLINGNIVDAMQIVTIKKKQYLQLNYKNEQLYFLISDKFNIINYFRSASYWYDVLEKYRNEYNFQIVEHYLPFKIDDVETIDYNEIQWLDVIMPTNMTDEVKFMYERNDIKYTLIHSSIKENNYATKAVVDKEQERVQKIIAERIEEEKKDSIADYGIFKAKILSGIVSENYDVKGDSVGLYDEFVFKIEGDLINGRYASWYGGKIKEGCVSNLKFEKDSHMDFLIKRGEKGELIRKKIAFTADSLRTIKVELYIDSLDKELDKVINEGFQKIKNKQIFIWKELYSYSDYKFGKKFKFYNCFNKAIKYIDVTLVAYNGVGDVQRDDIGRSTIKVRGIGPIEVDDFATYDWDELFWDDNDIIKKVVPTKITITFMNGTIISFVGERNIDKHRTGNCFVDED